MENYQLEIGTNVCVEDKSYKILRLLGHGKGGYSYLAESGGEYFVVKRLHHEPCDYYTFGDKFQSELNDYNTLSAVGISMPKLIAADRSAEIIVKQYIDGKTVAELLSTGVMEQDYLRQIRAMCKKLYGANFNIDYYPTNFVVENGKLYYIDYECNVYSSQWDFENWGAQYWKIGAFPKTDN